MTKKIVRKKIREEQRPKRRVRIVRKKRRKIGFFRRLKRGVAFVLFLALAIAAVVGGGALKKVNASLDKITRAEIGVTRSELMISDEAYAAQQAYNVTNIALFGKDVNQDEENIQRSDTILILSVNEDAARLISVQRDTYVKIPEHSPNKINMAYFHGGADLAVKTLNANLDMDISKYVSVDMEALVEIVDSVGGVELNITEEELPEMNAFINETNYMLGGDPSPFIESTGKQLCDGRQALVYARIRELGNSDFDRTARQRILLSEIYAKVKANLSVDTALSLLNGVSEHIETNLSNSEIIKLAYSILKAQGGVETYSLCSEDYIRSCDLSDSGMQILVPYTLSDMARELHGIIYGEGFEYTPSAQLLECKQAAEDTLEGEELDKIYTGTTF